MTYKPISNRAFSIWALVAGLEGLLALYFIIREPSEAESIFALGLSFQRLFIVIGVLFLALVFAVVAIAHYYRTVSWNKVLNKKPELIPYSLVVLFILELIVLHLLFFIPEYYSPRLFAYLSRLRPVLFWFALVFAQTLIPLLFFRGFSIQSIKAWQAKKSVLFVFAIIGIVWGFILVTRIGVIPDDFYWNVTGVPLLTGQIWIAAGATLILWLLVQRLSAKNSNTQISSLLIFIVIWIAAAIVWIKTPLTPTFNAPGPYPPSRGFYPFVDAALFDLGAQSAIYGKGLFFGSFVDRGLLSGFLVLVHVIFGQNYQMVVNVQSAIFAVFPALLYLLGEKLHSKSAGIMAAVLAIFKVSNAITGGKVISTSHPKLLLTEFPTGIVLVLFTLFIAVWLKNNSKTYYLAGAGASIGVGILLRNNVFFMLPVVLFLGMVVWRLNWKRALRDFLLVVIAFFITISPWMWRNLHVAGEPLFFLTQFNRVIEERYQPQSYLDQDRSASNLSPRLLSAHAALSRTKNRDALDQYQFIPKHFMHNLITSVLILPPSPVLDDFRHVIDIYPYWGRTTFSAPWSINIFLAVNLFILSLGIGSAWKRSKFMALAPLLVFLFYNLASAFARTSGGRYIVPIDWVVYFFYAMGLVEMIKFCLFALGFQADHFIENPVAGQHLAERDKLNWGKAGLAILPFFLMVATLPMLELASPGEQPPETTGSLLEKLEDHSVFEKFELSRQKVDEFLKSPDAILIAGRGLYPRYYSYGEGEPILPGEITPYTPQEFPRLVFTLLLPDSDRPVLLPIDDPRLHFPDAAEVIVGGCQVGQSTVLASYLNYIDAAFIVILDEPVTVYARVPEAPLVCPLREPVCDNNHNCN